MRMSTAPKPPETYQAFLERFPKIGQAWEAIAEAGRQGPLDPKAVRLVKLAVAVGAMREGAVHANVRKALAMGIPSEELEQVLALAAGTLGLPAAVAVFSWVRDYLGQSGQEQRGPGPVAAPSPLRDRSG
jgi:alkylhydroperoxidase/carboxymuconolactone decarboxylase family protein YurZ